MAVDTDGDTEDDDRALTLSIGANLGAIRVIEAALNEGVKGARDKDFAFKIIQALLNEGMAIVMRHEWYEEKALVDAIMAVIRRRTK